MKWTLEISDDELEQIIRRDARCKMENALANAVDRNMPMRHGRYGTYSEDMTVWERVCPGINDRIAAIQTKLADQYGPKWRSKVAEEYLNTERTQ